MVNTSTTLKGSGIGTGRVGIQNWIRVEADKMITAKKLVRSGESTTQEFITRKQLSDFGYPQYTGEGSASYLDSKIALYQANFTPLEYTLMFGITFKGQFTDQYGIFSSYKEDIKDSFVDLESLSICNLYNNAFSSSYTGIDGVALCSTAHPYQSYPTWSNRGDSSGNDMALSYGNIGKAYTQMRKVKTARQKQLRFRSGVRLVVPVDLVETGMAIMNSTGRYDTANREDNQVKRWLDDVHYEEDLSSTTAWFLQDMDSSKLGLFHLTQMPLTVLEGEFDPFTRTKYISVFKSFISSWDRAHRFWGTSGA